MTTMQTTNVAEIWYRIAWNQLPHLIPQGSGHMVANHSVGNEMVEVEKPNRNR